MRVSPTYGAGYMANVALFDDVLTPTEVTSLHMEGFADNTSGHLTNYYPLMGDFLDAQGSNDGTNNGSTEINVIDRPLGVLAPVEQTLDLSSLSLTDTLYIKNLFASGDVDITYGLDDYTIEYAEGRRIIIVRRR
jgi:hypothetical protein